MTIVASRFFPLPKLAKKRGNFPDSSCQENSEQAAIAKTRLALAPQTHEGCLPNKEVLIQPVRDSGQALRVSDPGTVQVLCAVVCCPTVSMNGEVDFCAASGYTLEQQKQKQKQHGAGTH